MILVQGFKKVFKQGFAKRSVGAENVSLTVERGEIHGFLGPNGAGKSTTIKALLGLIRPDGGVLHLFGSPVHEGSWRGRVGYMPEHPNFYEFLTGRELVSWFAQMSGLATDEADRVATRQLERVGLGHALDRRVRTYSKGMFQRAGLAQALVGDPELLILDEPMSGLDPIGRKDVRELLLELRDEGRTIFYSTHILPDIEMTCDRVTIVDKGVTRRSGRLEDILSETTRGITVSFDDLPEKSVENLRKRFANLRREGTQTSFDVAEVEEASRLAQELLGEEGARLARFEPHRDDLESIFLRSLDERASGDEEGRA